LKIDYRVIVLFSEKILLLSETQQLKIVPATSVEINGGFWGARQQTNRDRTIPAISHQMEITGRIDGWRLHWEDEKPKPSMQQYAHFWDSDMGKWIEAIGHSLRTHPDPELEQFTDEIIDLIASAQQPDGYLNIYFTGIDPQNKWRNLRDWHELYNAGHLIEGAVAYYQATGKRKLLDVMCRYVDLIDSKFGPDEGKKRGYCGHPEIELALVKLYHATGEQRYLDLSKYFIDERGQQPHYFDIETRERGEDPAKFWAKTYRYCQAHLPIREQKTATGHSVRANYLYAGVADIAAETGDSELVDISRSIWDDLTQHQMYITGGLGPAHANEGFTFAYDLPNETAYAETCASCALVFWAQRMFMIDPDSRYIDVLERALYNNVLAGVSYDGDHFFYANPLASYPNVNPFDRFSGITSEQHYHRSEWFDCPCCPPNLARLVASIGDYFYVTTPDTLYVNLYNQNRAHFQFGGGDVQIEQQTTYPYDGAVNFTVSVDQPTAFTLALRVPDWCRDFSVEVNGSLFIANPERGYVRISRDWSNGDQVSLSLSMPVERMLAHPQVRQDAGNIALQRGPLVYCLEEVDNGAGLANVVIPPDAELRAEYDDALFGAVRVIRGEALRIEPAQWDGGLYQPESAVKLAQKPFTFKAIPYAFWANRQPGEMRVWIRES
jgi:uncharacterized protein